MSTGFLLYGNSSNLVNQKSLIPVSSAWTTTSPTYRYLNDLDANTGAAMSTLSPPQYGVRGFTTSRMEYGWLGQVGTIANVSAAVANGTVSAVNAMPSVTAPILQWITPAAGDTMMSSSFMLQVQAFAAASDGILGGVSSVDFWVNDSLPVNVSQMTAGTVGVYGGTRLTPVYQVLIPYVKGAVLDFYARANVTPAMAAQGMQPRVIGPMRVYFQDNYDAEFNLFAPGSTNPAATGLNPLSYTPGANYDSIPKALNAIASWTGWPSTGYQVRIKAVEDMVQDVGGTASGTSGIPAFTNNMTKTNARRGRVTIDGNGFNMLLNSNRWMNATTTNTDMWFQYNGITLTNLKMDNTRMGTLLRYNNETIVNLLDNVEIYGTSNIEMPGTDGTQMCPRPSFWTGATLTQMTRCYVHDMSAGDFQIPARIGTKLRNQAGDAVSVSTTFDLTNNVRRLPYYPMGVVNDDMDNVSSYSNNSPKLVMTLTYSGSGSNPTYAIRGEAGRPGAAGESTVSHPPRTLALRVNNGSGSVDVATFSGNYPGSTTGIQSISDLAAAINAWSAANAGGAWTAATVGDPSVYNHYRATFICTQRYKTGNTYPQNQDWEPNANATPDSVSLADVPIAIGVWTGNAQHPDLLQLGVGDNIDNFLYSGIYATNFNTQGLTIQSPSYFKASNIALVNVAYNSTTNAIEFATFNSYFGGSMNHCLVAHNTSPSGNDMLINCLSTNFIMDQFCRFDSNYANCMYFKVGTTGTTPFSNFAPVILGQFRRNRALIKGSTQGGTTWSWASIYSDVQSNNAVLDPTNTVGLRDFADYPKISTGTFIKNLTLDPTGSGIPTTFSKSDFIPDNTGKGFLRQTANLVQSQIPFDIEGRPRLASDLVGPVAASATT